MQEVESEKAKGSPYCYRFRVPKHQDITVQDAVRGHVTFNTDTLGDFVIMRSNGLPVYNFCVAADDALMKITHVIRAEEHLPNTLRQVCSCVLQIHSEAIERGRCYFGLAFSGTVLEFCRSLIALRCGKKACRKGERQ